MPGTVPEPQTLRGCVHAQKECRKEVFAKIETDGKETRALQESHQTVVMDKLGAIEQKLAFTAGQENGRKNTGQNPPVAKRQWPAWLSKCLFTWGPFLLLVLFLGVKGWLEKMGWW